MIGVVEMELDENGNGKASSTRKAALVTENRQRNLKAMRRCAQKRNPPASPVTSPEAPSPLSADITPGVNSDSDDDDDDLLGEMERHLEVVAPRSEPPQTRKACRRCEPTREAPPPVGDVARVLARLEEQEELSRQQESLTTTSAAFAFRPGARGVTAAALLLPPHNRRRVSACEELTDMGANIDHTDSLDDPLLELLLAFAGFATESAPFGVSTRWRACKTSADRKHVTAGFECSTRLGEELSRAVEAALFEACGGRVCRGYWTRQRQLVFNLKDRAKQNGRSSPGVENGRWRRMDVATGFSSIRGEQQPESTPPSPSSPFMRRRPPSSSSSSSS
mmetsp:Transcript_11328/g.22729  ORF Transcript_11328/g.22729 Transcript_11328/m.22729 type:complete len:336 (+) Transcript_11328:49-1056(+)